jgi:hypothetical protein
MGQLSAEMIAKLAGFRQDIIDALTADLNAGENVDAIATGACSLERVVTELTISGTKAYTLAAPTRTGQKKIIRCVSAASTPAGTLTVSSPDNTTGFVCPATFFFDNVGQEIELEATAGLKWRCVRKIRTGWKTLVVGTTVTTGICDMSHVALSVTGTVASTTADKAIPNGAARGERLIVGCSTAASTPHGDIAMTGIDQKGATFTVLDDFTATTDHMVFEWSGARWQLVVNNTTAVTLTTP